MKRTSCYGLLLLAVVGCGGKPEAGSTTAQTETKPASAVAAGASTVAPTVVANGAGTEPGEVVAMFLDSLRRGDETVANGALTTLAQSELKKTNFVIQPLGVEEGKFTIGRVAFQDGDTTAGLVECTWSEPAKAGEEASTMEVVFEVHKEPVGWRISGMAVKTGPEETFVLDFENAESLQAALSGAGEAPQNTAAATAQMPPASGTPAQSASFAMPGQAPAQSGAQLPQMPGAAPAAQPAPGSQQSPTQIAFPPSPTVNR